MKLEPGTEKDVEKNGVEAVETAEQRHDVLRGL